MKRVILDFETRSMCDLKKRGAYEYSLDPTTKPTCLAFKIKGREPVYFLKFETINKAWVDLPDKLRSFWERLIKENYEFAGHNALFETVIYNNILVKRYGWPEISPRQWRCTAAKAAACALPRSLEGAGTALNLTTQKDTRGYIAMMLTCKPTRQYNAWAKARAEVSAGKRVGKKKQLLSQQKAPPVFLEYRDNPGVWETLYEYCRIDVKTEELLDDTLPDLIPVEQEIWFLNQRLNWNGLRIDLPTVKKIVSIMEFESKQKLKELDSLTLGLVTKAGARQSILNFLALDDIVLPDLRAKTVEDVLKGGDLNPDMRRLLEIRQQLSKTSTRKYQGFLNRSGEDHRVRDILLYHGAVPTGRDTGTGVQPHNFPRGVVAVNKDRPYSHVENIIKYPYPDLKILYGESLPLVFSSILRNMIIPSEGCELFVADFSKIEVAVLWWLAGNQAGLEILRSGKDPYIYQAAKNLNKTYEEVALAVKRGEKWAEDARQLGKAQILGCGFRMGWKKFQTSAHDMYRLKLTSRQSFDAVKSYREANEPVTRIWEAYENAAIEAIENPGRKVKAGKCLFFVRKGFLWVELPSGRRLAYKSPTLVWRTITFTALEQVKDKKGKLIEVEVEKTSSPKKTVSFLGLDKSKKKLTTEFIHGGVITENIVQAVARDLMMEGMLRVEKHRYKPLLMVHDEGICEKKAGTGTIEEFQRILCKRPLWGDENLPLEAKGWIGPRYRK